MEANSSALTIVLQVLLRVRHSGLISDFDQEDEHQITKALNEALNNSGSARSSSTVLKCLHEALSVHRRAVAHLLVQACCAKALGNSDLSHDEDDEDHSSSDDQTPEPADTSTPRPTPSSSGNPLVGKSPPAIAGFLIEQLQEIPAVKPRFIQIANMLGPHGVWELLQECSSELESGTPLTMTTDGKKRTPGGVFLSLAKKRQGELARQQKQVSDADITLRPYQQDAVDVIADKQGNWVIAAPTGTGKTAIFIELSKQLLKSKPTGTVVVLVPTVSLVRQQSTAYEKSGFRPASEPSNASTSAPTVDWFCGDKPLPAATWKQEIARLNIIVIEGQSFCNVLESGKASLADVDMLVIDECHHTAKQHPYARVMQHYKLLCKDDKPQVLGFSASPANGRTSDMFKDNMDQLLAVLDACAYAVHEDDSTVQQVAPGPQEDVKCVDVRAADGRVQEWIRHLMHVYAIAVGADLDQQLKHPTVPPSSRLTMQKHPLPEPDQIVSNPRHAYNTLCSWLNQAADLAVKWNLVNLGQCVYLLEVLRKAEAFCEDTGYECALQYIARQLVNLVVDCSQKATRQNESLLALLRPMQVSRPAAFAAADSTMASLRAHMANAPFAADIAQAQAMESRLSSLVPCQDIKLDARRFSRRFVGDLSTWTGDFSPLEAQVDWSTVPVTPEGSEVCNRLVAGAVETLVPGGIQPPVYSHYKVWELIQYLRKYRHHATFHGIIFCRSRQVAHYLVELLRSARLPPVIHPVGPATARQSKPLLDFVDEVSLFVGHGANRDNKGRAGQSNAVRVDMLGMPGANEGTAARGMDIHHQQAVLNKFKLSGRKLLVATNAAEEGLDVPCCEFVVRFSPPATGIQSVQGRGRARKLGAHYMCLLQHPAQGSLLHGGSDTHLYVKSKDEEHVMRTELRRIRV